MKTTVWIVIVCLGTAALLSGCKQQTLSVPNAVSSTTNAASGTTNTASGTTNAASGTNVLNDDKARVSYAIGMSMGQNLQNLQSHGGEIDVNLITRGIKDLLSGSATLLTPEEAQQTLASFQKEFAARQQARREELAVKNKAEGEAFLATNKNNPGVVALPDGLQYKVITNGNGATPAPTDTVTVNYRGTLLDGTEFDSSYKRGQPATFSVNGVIPGWTEALLKMKAGSKWHVFIPAELAYGERGQSSIPPNSVLIFEIELLSTQSFVPPAPLTSDIIKVPSADELKKGAKPEVIKTEDLKKMQQP